MVMRGKILDFSIAENHGVISGDDGARYGFAGAEWKSSTRPPVPGLRVDFVAAGDEASAVYVDVGPGAASLSAREDPYRGLYCSSDEKILLGLCGGLAHKYGLQPGVVRGLVFILTFWMLWFPYLIAFFLPKLPTRDVPRPV
jgi:phage shock protein PspC (stress-responsive transcriptional regulator)